MKRAAPASREMVARPCISRQTLAEAPPGDHISMLSMLMWPWGGDGGGFAAFYMVVER